MERSIPSFFWILRQAYHLNASNILKEDQKYGIIRELIDKTKLRSRMRRNLSRASPGKSAWSRTIGFLLRTIIPKTVLRNCSERSYTGYQERIESMHLLDFDDMLVMCYQLLKKREDIRRGWQERFQYILIDEFQDINSIQYDTVRLLAEPKDNLFIVGDDDQSIYRFRGARPEIMLNFEKDYPGATKILLAENYRSTENIIRAAGKVIAFNEKRFPKEIHGVREKGDPVEIHSFTNPTQETSVLLKKIQEYRKQGYEYRDLAVLFRTNTGARIVVEKLMEYNLPFQMRDSLPNIYEHWITKDILCYLRLSRGSRKRQDFLKIANRPKRYIAREALEDSEISFLALRRYYEKRDWMLGSDRPLEYDLEGVGRYGALCGYQLYPATGSGMRNIWKNMQSFGGSRWRSYIRSARLSEGAKEFQTYEAWLQHMEEYKEVLEEQARQRRESGEGITSPPCTAPRDWNFRWCLSWISTKGSSPTERRCWTRILQRSGACSMWA